MCNGSESLEAMKAASIWGSRWFQLGLTSQQHGTTWPRFAVVAFLRYTQIIQHVLRPTLGAAGCDYRSTGKQRPNFQSGQGLLKT